MAKIIKQSYVKQDQRRVLEFGYYDAIGAGYIFPIEYGKPVFGSEEGKKNYEWCLNNPDKVKCLGERIENWYCIVPAIAQCECGEIIRLDDEYYGCSKCPACGRWHAQGGDEVNPPEEWLEDFEPDE